ncbi:MAG: oligosaccharide flippase family protein [Coriobacteriia bacterium]
MLKAILRSAGTDTLKYFPVRLVPALTALVTVPVFSRMITREDYGDFYLVNSAVSFMAVLLTSWLSASIVRFYWNAEREGRMDGYVATVVWSSVIALAIGAALLTPVILLLSKVFGPGLVRLLPMALATLILNQFIQNVQQLMRAANKARRYATLAIASALLTTVFSVFFVAALHWGSFGILAGVALGNLLFMPLAIRYARQEGNLAPRNFSRETLSDFTAYGLPMIPAALSSWILILSDRYIIGLTQSAADVGLYGTAYNLGDKIMGLITAPLLIAIGPVLVQTFEKRGQLLTQQVQSQLTRYFTMATAPVAFGLAVVAQPFMRVFTGEAYHAGYPALPVVATGVALYGMSQIASNGLALHKKTVLIMQNTLIAAVAQVVANLLLVPRFGYLAAAWNTLGAYFLLLVLAWWRSRQFMAWHVPWLDIGRAVAAGVLMAGVLHLGFRNFEPSLWTLASQVILGIAVYAAALRVLGALRPDEIEFLRELRAKAWPW